MGRAPCCDKDNVKKGPWSPEEDAKLKDFIEKHGTAGNWIALPHKAGLKRCGKSCRLRWLNYLRPNLRHGEFSHEEDRIICTLFATIGSRWSVIAAQLPGRTDNDIKNYWNTKLKKKLMGITTTTSTATTNSTKRAHQKQEQQKQLLLPSPSPSSSSSLSNCYSTQGVPLTGFQSPTTASNIFQSPSHEQHYVREESNMIAFGRDKYQSGHVGFESCGFGGMEEKSDYNGQLVENPMLDYSYEEIKKLLNSYF